jgi:hypothetical protein
MARRLSAEGGCNTRWYRPPCFSHRLVWSSRTEAEMRLIVPCGNRTLRTVRLD